MTMVVVNLLVIAFDTIIVGRGFVPMVGPIVGHGCYIRAFWPVVTSQGRAPADGRWIICGVLAGTTLLAVVPP